MDAKPKFTNVKDGRVRGWERRFLPARNTIRVISIVVFKEDVRSCSIPTNGGGNIKSIASGGAHSLVVTSKGEVFATGLNEYGQCGIRIINNADDDKGGENGESSNNNAKTTMNDIVRGWTRVEFRDATCDGNVNVEIEQAISGRASSPPVCIAGGG